jgi:uncharacterized Zn finger protein (UPF0148 family)
MALINCPECGKQISDKAVTCPYCGLPGSYFTSVVKEAAESESKSIYQPGNTQAELSVDIQADFRKVESHDGDYNIIRNVLISFEKDYTELFASQRYIPTSEHKKIYKRYEKSFFRSLSLRNIKRKEPVMISLSNFR